MSPRGCEQQISTLPSAGGSTGSGLYSTPPAMSVVSQLWHTPVRHDQRTGTSHASANSSRLAYSLLHGTARLLRANSMVGPVPGWPLGGWGLRVGVAAMP